MRLFYALALPPWLAGIQAGMKERLGAQASWPRPEGLHLTLAFLGEQPEGMLPRLIQIGHGAAAQGTPFALRTASLGTFPRAKVLWLGVEPEPALEALNARLRGALGTGGVAFDAKPLRPHITLGRLKAPLEVATLGADPEPRAFTVDHLTLFKSQTTPEGVVYEAVERFPLGRY